MKQLICELYAIVVNGVVALQIAALIYFLLFAAAGGIEGKEPRWFSVCLNVALALIPSFVVVIQLIRRYRH